MTRIKQIVKRYRLFLLFFALNIALLFFAPETGGRSVAITRNNLLEMASILPPIFVLLGLLDVWVERETMVKYMGKGSGAKGGVIAFILGAAAAGPLYAAFPVAVVLIRKGARLLNVFIFIGAWSTTKIPLLLFEASNLGIIYTLLRLAFNIAGIILIAFILEKSLSEKDRQDVIEKIEAA